MIKKTKALILILLLSIMALSFYQSKRSLDKTKVLVIGVEGASWNYIMPWVKQGKLPNIARLIENGAYGNLTGVRPATSSASFTSLATGVPPFLHGVLDYSHQDRTVTTRDRKYPPIWHLLSEKGKKVGVVKPPVSYPVQKINGFIIAGYPIPGDNYKHPGVVYPPDLKEEIKKWEEQDKPRQRYEIPRVTNETIYLIENKPWDFFLVYYQIMDWIGDHYYPQKPGDPLYDAEWDERHGNHFLRKWREMDKAIGRILEHVNNETIVFVVSSHGFEKETKLQILFHINNWLIENEFLKLKEDTDRYENWEEKINWSETKAYAHPDHYSGRIEIFINLENREPYGIVKKEDYEKVRAEILERLYNTCTSDLVEGLNGIKIFDQQKDWGESKIYLGSAEDPPDIIFRDYRLIRRRRGNFVVWTQPDFNSNRNFEDACEGLKLICQRGNHILMSSKSRNGMLIVKGPMIKKNRIIQNVSLLDIAPTILEMFKLNSPAYMTSSFLKRMVS